MEELTFKSEYHCDDAFIKSKALQPGKVYIAKDGKVMLYLGRLHDARYLFYLFTLALLKDDYSSNVTIVNYKAQTLGLCTTINASMSGMIKPECLLAYKIIPKIYGEFSLVNLDAIYKNWYAKCQALKGGELPSVFDSLGEGAKTPYVHSKDLIPGEIYYTGDCWRSVYAYLGRNSERDYIWYYLCNGRITLGNSGGLVSHLMRRTRQNKKVKPLSMAPIDCDFPIPLDASNLIDTQFKLDVSQVTQEMLDAVE